MADEKKPDETRRENHFLIDSVKNIFTVVIHLDKEPATALGTLEMAKDAVKNVYMQKAMQKVQAKPGIIVPNANGKGGLHAV